MCEHHDKLRSDNKDFQKIENQIDRRQFLTKTSLGLGALALSSLLNIDKVWGGVNAQKNEYLNNNKLGLPHHAPKAKRIVYLFELKMTFTFTNR